LHKLIANAFNKATAFCNASTRANRTLEPSLHKRPFLQGSDLSNDETFTGRFHYRFGYFSKNVDFENPLDLCQQTVQQPKITAGSTDDYRDGFRF
jgi:hypothetical protein